MAANNPKTTKSFQGFNANTKLDLYVSPHTPDEIKYLSMSGAITNEEMFAFEQQVEQRDPGLIKFKAHIDSVAQDYGLQHIWDTALHQVHIFGPADGISKAYEELKDQYHTIKVDKALMSRALEKVKSKDFTVNDEEDPPFSTKKSEKPILH